MDQQKNCVDKAKQGHTFSSSIKFKFVSLFNKNNFIFNSSILRRMILLLWCFFFNQLIIKALSFDLY